MSRNWTPDPNVHPLPGEAADRIVADAHGVRRETICIYRQHHGIPPGGRMGRPRGSGAWEPDGDPMPGTPGTTDQYIAEAHGVCVATVLRWRRRNGVPPGSHQD